MIVRFQPSSERLESSFKCLVYLEGYMVRKIYDKPLTYYNKQLGVLAVLSMLSVHALIQYATSSLSGPVPVL